MLGIFLDTETNGLNSNTHKILELAYKIVDLTTGEIKEEFQTLISQPHEDWTKSDQSSLKINGFTWEEIQSGKSPKEVEKLIIDSFTKWGIQRKKSVFICQNPSFDRVFFSQIVDSTIQEELRWPYHWLDLASMFWSTAMDKAKKKQGELPWEIGCSKDLIAAHYHLPKESSPHRAMNGVSHLLLCYKSVVGFPNQGHHEKV